MDSMGLLSGDANREITASQSAAMRALCEATRGVHPISTELASSSFPLEGYAPDSCSTRTLP